AEAGREWAAAKSLRDALKAAPELVIMFGDAVKGPAVQELVEFGDSLGIPVRYVCLVDYMNSRGAMDMGLVPGLLPGYRPAAEAGLSLPEMLAAPDLDAVWVVGANPLKRAALAAEGAFVVVQDLFLTETAGRADVVLPAACAYEKSGTVTNVCGELQRLKRAATTMGVKPDLEIFRLLSGAMGLELAVPEPERVYAEMRQGGASLAGVAAKPELVVPSGDTLFTSGTLGRYCKALGSVVEAPGGLYRWNS
ncbi:MAG TPA: molybdopterin-dependent oxidoreductase, partial [Bryobacteraceae bacterium]|nr:molybdopterin-dependent oxidoreductase [Bryobacteraceae bacterium]